MSFSKFFQATLLFFIKLYQKTLSLDHGFLKFLKPSGQCKFYPTCSEYAYQAIEKYGIIKGVRLSFGRIAHCHPFSDGGYDPLP
jgi:uncharacterized protein